MNLLVNTHLFCLNFLFILPGANGRNSGSHEVSGSIPLFLLMPLLNRIDSISNLYIFTYLYLYYVGFSNVG